MPKEIYPTLVGSSLIPVGIKAGLKATKQDKVIAGKVPLSLVLEGITAVGGSIATFVVKKPTFKAIGAGAGIGGIVLTVNDIIELYALPAIPTGTGGSSESTLDEYLKRYGG